MKIRAILLIALTSSFCLAGSPDLKSEIKKRNLVLGTIMRAKNFEGFKREVSKGVTKDFVHVQDGRSMNLSKMLETVKGGLASMSKVTVAKSELQSLKIESKIAHAVTKHTVAYESKSEDGKLHKFVSSGVTHDEYRLVGKDWKMSKMEWVKNDLTVDGKPVKM